MSIHNNTWQGYIVTTNVGWMPLFPRFAAVVTDVEAPLSHAATIAREFVVRCSNAISVLKTVGYVRVDGPRSTVEIL